MVVLVLIGLLAMMMVPSFQNLLVRNLNWEAKRLKGVIHLLRNDAVLTGRHYRLMLDMEQGAYWAEVLAEDGRFQPVQGVKELSRHEFTSSIKIVEMVLYGEDTQPAERKVVPVGVDPSGFVDPFQLKLEVDGKPFSLKAEGLTGKLELTEGYGPDHNIHGKAIR